MFWNVGPVFAFVRRKGSGQPRTAICGTDVHIYDWNDWAKRTIPTPMVVGHEYCGVIKEMGSHLSLWI